MQMTNQHLFNGYKKPQFKFIAILVLLAFLFSSVLNVKPARADGGDFIAGAIGAGIVMMIGNEIQKNNYKKPKKRRLSAAAIAEPKMSRTEKRLVQNKLNQLGFNVGRADGSFGRKTRAGIKRYQANINAAMTGYLTNYQFNQLSYAGVVSNSPIASTAPVVSTTIEVSGTQYSAQDIVSLQQTLGALGYDVGPITGQLNAKTESAIENFVAAREYLPDDIKATENYKTANELTLNHGIQLASTVRPVAGNIDPEVALSAVMRANGCLVTEAHILDAVVSAGTPLGKAKEFIAAYKAQLLLNYEGFTQYLVFDDPETCGLVFTKSLNIISKEIRSACDNGSGGMDRFGSSLIDLNNDGQRDLIISHDRIKCDRQWSRSSFCGAQVCSTKIYLMTNGRFVENYETLGILDEITEKPLPILSLIGHGGHYYKIAWDGIKFYSF